MGRIWNANEEVHAGTYDATTIPGQGTRTARNGGIIQPAYMFQGTPKQEEETSRQAIARLMTQDRQFARNFVNRFWAHFFGEGFVANPTGWDLGRIDAETAASFDTSVQARNSALMEHLTDIFMESDYDLRSFMRVLTNSPLYQLDTHKTQVPANHPLAYWHSDIRMRRLEAEAIVDGIFDSLGQRPTHIAMGQPTTPRYSTWELPGGDEPNPGALNYPYETDPRDAGFPTLGHFLTQQEAVLKQLHALGRGNPFDMETRSNESLISTLLVSLNHKERLGWIINLREAPFLQKLQNDLINKNRQEIVTTLYQTILFREPTTHEATITSQYIASQGIQHALPDVAWALFNHPDFWYR